MIEFFVDLAKPSTLFLVIGFLLIISELFIGIEAGFDLVLVGSIFVLSSFVGIFTGSAWVMIAVAIFLSVAYIIFGRSIVKKQIIVLTHKTNIDNVIGKTGIVVRDISTEEAGRVKLNSEEWRAMADEEIRAGDKIKVSSIEGVSLKVIKTK